MKNIFFYLFLFLLIASFKIAFAQNFISYVYNDENGLASNLSKSITQDDEGFIWIATDAGLSKFDGSSFTNYQINLPSLFVKQIYNTRDHQLNIVTDFGIGNFIKTDTGYIYKTMLSSSRNESNQNLYYPKNVFEDSRGIIWISDLNGISTFVNNKFKKYQFDDRFHADSYFRSFLLTEIGNHKIIATSQKGYIFYFNQVLEKFVQLPFSPPAKNFSINALAKYSDNSILIGASDGLYLVEISGHANQIEVKKISDIKQISSIAINNDNDIFIGTWDSGLYTGKIKSSSTVSSKKFEGLNFSSIKDLFIDRQNNLWVASDQGIALVKKTFFGNLTEFNHASKSNLFIQQILTGTHKNIYYTDGNSIFKIVSKNGKTDAVKVLTSQASSILSFAITGKGFWISYRNQRLEYRDKNSLKVIFSYRLNDDRFNSLFVDDKGQLWAYLARRGEVIKFDHSFKPETFSFNFNNFDFINLFNQSKDGTIYCAGSGTKSFLFKFDKSQKKFVDITPPNYNDSNTQIQVFDLQFSKNNKIYLATSRGLLIFHDNKISQFIIPSYFQSKIIKAIRIDEDKIWLGTERGILSLSSNGSANFDKQDGLPNSTIVNQGLVEDSSGNLWAATASGVCFWQSDYTSLMKTSKPIFIDIRNKTQGQSQNFTGEHKFISGSSITCTFISLNFPSDRVLYEYRIIRIDSTWSTPKFLNTINLYNLSPGNYTLQVRAKTPGFYWSKISNYALIIEPHWYLSEVMFLVYSMVILLIIVLSVKGFYNARIKKLRERENLLAQMVNEKTNDFLLAKTRAENLLEESESAKKKLEEATQQKSHMLSIAAHDLKNPLQSLIGFSSMIAEDSNDPEIKNMANIIFDSSKDMLGQINDMLEAAAVESKNLKLELKTVSINKILNDVIQSNSKRAIQKQQTIIAKLDNDCQVFVDEYWLKIAIDNLVSNAVKYSPLGKKIFVSTEILNENLLIKIKDEGHGLTAADMEKLFNRYQRLSAKPTGGETSTGLGLSIVKDVIEIHNGKVWAESKPGSGAEFIIQLSIYN
ncbi:MAG: sensor histidine kinase [Ignavibacteriaceae bacterium]